MSETASPPPASNRTPATPPRRGGFGACLGRFISAILMIVLAASLALGAAVAGAFYLGFTPDTARSLSQAQIQVATLEVLNASLVQQQLELQTRVSQMSRDSSNDRETIDEIRNELAELNGLRTELEEQLSASTQENATMLAEMRTSRDSVTQFATAEAGRAELLAELRRRSERIERFLQRLSDISGDAALDISDGTTFTPTTTLEPIATPSFTPSPEPIATPSPEAPPPTPTATPPETPPPTATPRATQGLTVTPTATLTATPRP